MRIQEQDRINYYLVKLLSQNALTDQDIRRVEEEKIIPDDDDIAVVMTECEILDIVYFVLENSRGVERGYLIDSLVSIMKVNSCKLPAGSDRFTKPRSLVASAKFGFRC